MSSMLHGHACFMPYPCMSVSMLHVHVTDHSACPCPCCMPCPWCLLMSLSILHVHVLVHAACLCLWCMSKSILHFHLCYMSMSMLHVLGRVHYSFPFHAVCPCPCPMLFVHVHAAYLSQCYMSMSMLYVYVHSACECPSGISMSIFRYFLLVRYCIRPWEGEVCGPCE